jgi:hypothetical protein
VSLKSRKSIDQAGPDNHEEKVISFRKEPDGTYTKITKTMIRDWKTSSVKSLKRLPDIEEGPFVLSEASDQYDEEMTYQDFDGSIKRMYFKRAGVESETS